jgi:hypothetical protein
MELVILQHGSNHFKPSHLGKERLLHRGMVLETPPVSEELLEKLEDNENQAPMAPAAAPVAPGEVVDV